MPLNGDTNERFGVYMSVCCGMEIVIAEGAKFPYCPNHPKLSTKWKSTTDEPIPHVNELPSTGKKSKPAA
jgi:hypothetical protein